MALHIARSRTVASSACSPMPAKPAIPHTSASSRRSSYGRRAGLVRFTAQHVSSRPQDSEEKIEHREAGVSAEETSEEESDHRPLNPQGLYRAVIRLQKRAPTSHLSQHRPHQTKPEQQAGESHLRSHIDIGVVCISLPQLWRIAPIGLLVASDADPEDGVTRDDAQAGLKDFQALAGRVRCELNESLFAAGLLAVLLPLSVGLGIGQCGNTMPRGCRNQYGDDGEES